MLEEQLQAPLLPPPPLSPGPFWGWVRHMYLRVDFDIGKFALKQGGKLDTLLRTFLVPFSFFIVILLRLTSNVGYLR